jgi:hypothetical protein
VVVTALEGFIQGICHYFHQMPEKPPPSEPSTSHSGRRGDPVSLSPLSMDEAVDAIFQIKPADVKKILASRPGKKKADRHA